MLFHVKQASLCTITIATKWHLELSSLDVDSQTQWKSNAISNAITRQVKANQRHRFNHAHRPRQTGSSIVSSLGRYRHQKVRTCLPLQDLPGSRSAPSEA